MSEGRHIDVILCGDVMTGRGIDQVLPCPGEPTLHESHVRSALDYVRLAEAANGPIPRPVDFDYPWGDALDWLAGTNETVRIINLETGVTQSPDFEPKGINYRMHPGNVGCIGAGKADCCVLANNHVLDWGQAGLRETLATLENAGIGFAGAGRDEAQASRPWICELAGGGRILVFGFGCMSSGIAPHWAADNDRPGVNLIRRLSRDSAEAAIDRIASWRRPGDIIVVSVHWGGNWGYAVAAEEVDFAHRLVDSGTVDIIHGHSSHHAKAAEIRGGRPVLYGCGDFINDYEGITGYERYRGDLSVLHVARFDAARRNLLQLRLIVFQMRNFRLRRASQADVSWLEKKLDGECKRFGSRVRRLDAHSLCIEAGR